MPRHWVVAPVESKNPDLFDKVWQFDLANNIISIGWSELGDISKMSREMLSDAIGRHSPISPHQRKDSSPTCSGLFYHEIGPGDFVIARQGEDPEPWAKFSLRFLCTREKSLSRVSQLFPSQIPSKSRGSKGRGKRFSPASCS